MSASGTILTAGELIGDSTRVSSLRMKVSRKAFIQFSAAFKASDIDLNFMLTMYRIVICRLEFFRSLFTNVQGTKTYMFGSISTVEIRLWFFRLFQGIYSKTETNSATALIVRCCDFSDYVTIDEYTRVSDVKRQSIFSICTMWNFHIENATRKFYWLTKSLLNIASWSFRSQTDIFKSKNPHFLNPTKCLSTIASDQFQYALNLSNQTFWPRHHCCRLI